MRGLLTEYKLFIEQYHLLQDILGITAPNLKSLTSRLITFESTVEIGKKTNKYDANKITNNVEKLRKGPRKQCDYCKKYGHEAEKCWELHLELKRLRDSKETEKGGNDTGKSSERERIVGMVTVNHKMFELLDECQDAAYSTIRNSPATTQTYEQLKPLEHTLTQNTYITNASPTQRSWLLLLKTANTVQTRLEMQGITTHLRQDVQTFRKHAHQEEGKIALINAIQKSLDLDDHATDADHLWLELLQMQTENKRCGFVTKEAITAQALSFLLY
ncbi:hypothetical protein BDU57DRAFT_541484 [Ampelomyces quisqualis]|uniref:Uncharacterized protein n=1 Tax=Ampelomyces quisqualis TaxID=50730 RepID=A0A6A5QAW6_AMPQU|nr:hypothetical protein BDU57DRAFT_541484 [Ampelomyces quisqualis]